MCSSERYTAENQPGPRSRLFSIPPIRQGAYRESLLSYLVRVARAHQMPVRALIRSELLWETKLKSGPAFSPFYREQARTLNGVGTYAREFVQALERLTFVTRLDTLTMLPWKDVVPENGTGLLAKEVRWCSACLAEQREEAVESHFPLLWSLEHYRACDRHGQMLRTACPWCGKKQAVVPDFPDQARCTHCCGWLGKVQEGEIQPEEGQDLLTQSIALAAAISANDEAAQWARHDILCARLTALAERWADGEKGKLSLRLGLTKTTMSCWVTKGQRASFPQLLQVCDTLTVTLPQLFDVTAELPEPYKAGARLLSVSARPRRRVTSRMEIEKKLKAHMNLLKDSKPVLSLAGELGVSRAYLNYWFPHLTRAISDKHQNQVRQQTYRRRAAEFEVVRRIAHSLVEQGSVPSRRSVEQQLRPLRLSLKRPDLRRVFIDNRDAYTLL